MRRRSLADCGNVIVVMGSDRTDSLLGTDRSESQGRRERTCGNDDAPRLIYAVDRFDRALRAQLKRRLAPLNLTISEFITLSVLSARTGVSNAQLARLALVTPQAMNQVLLSLGDKGLIRRQSFPAGTESHHRARAVQLTARGRRQVRRSAEIVDSIEDDCFGELDADVRGTVAAMFTHASQRLNDVAEPRMRGRFPAGSRDSFGM